MTIITEKLRNRGFEEHPDMEYKEQLIRRYRNLRIAKLVAWQSYRQTRFQVK
jgi:uncharacterized protein YaaN involved in tellurite resistance